MRAVLTAGSATLPTVFKSDVYMLLRAAPSLALLSRTRLGNRRRRSHCGRWSLSTESLPTSASATSTCWPPCHSGPHHAQTCSVYPRHPVPITHSPSPTACHPLCHPLRHPHLPSTRALSSLPSATWVQHPCHLQAPSWARPFPLEPPPPTACWPR